MSEINEKLETMSPLRVLVIGIIIGIVIAMPVFYFANPFQKLGGGTGNVEIEDIQITSPKIGIGGKTEVLVTVKNTGGKAKTHALTLRVDGEIKKSKNITMASKENKTVLFEVKGEELGTHTLRVGEMSKDFEVLEHGVFTSQDYGFNLEYPSYWSFNKKESIMGLNLTLRENKTQGVQPKAQAQISVQKLNQNLPSLDNIKRSSKTQIENNENISWISEPEITNTDSYQELNLTVKSRSGQSSFIIKQRIIRNETNQYSIQAFAYENYYETFDSDIEQIVENFKLV